MLGGFLALIAAVTFAVNNACFRRGALTGSAAQGMAVSLALGVPIFLIATLAAGAWDSLLAFSPLSLALFCGAGVVHFAWGRYCNYRATKAMGANLVGPPQQAGIVVSLALAIIVLGEALTPLRILGIALVLVSPALSLRARRGTQGLDVPNARPVFQPNLVEGYTFAFLSAIGFGASPVMVRMALESGGLPASVAGALVAYVAATLVMAFALFSTSMRLHLRAIDRVSLRWFTASGVVVCISQMTAYMALAVAPVTVVTPIQRLSLVFRVFANSILNREHEVIGGRIWLATIVGLAGAVTLSLSTDLVLDLLPLPGWFEDAARWQWPAR